MFLTNEEEGMLNGEYGPGIKRSMELLVKHRPRLQKLLKSDRKENEE